MKSILALLVCGLMVVGCSNMSNTQQRALSGTAIGAGGGAVLGAIGGNAALGAVAGAAAGLAGGLIYQLGEEERAVRLSAGIQCGQAIVRHTSMTIRVRIRACQRGSE